MNIKLAEFMWVDRYIHIQLGLPENVIYVFEDGKNIAVLDAEKGVGILERAYPGKIKIVETA